MARNYSNTAIDTTLVGAIGAGDASFVVASATGWPTAPFAAVLDPGLVTEEVVQATNKAGTTFTITRGFDGTTAAAHANGATVRHSAIAGDFTDLQAADAANAAVIVSEAGTRASADTALSSAISTEATARSSADATLQTNINGKQPLDATLTALAALVIAADKLIYGTGPDAFALADFTAAARAFVAATDAAGQRSALGLVIGTDVQAFNANLAALAGLTLAADRSIYSTGPGALALYTLSSFMRTLLDDADQATARATLGAAPITPKYLTTASDSELSAEIAIPGLAASPDIKGSAGAGTSREFESGDAAPTFTSAPAATDVGVTALSHLYVQTTDTTERFAYYSWSPAGAFDVRCRFVATLNAVTGSPDISLMVANAGRTDRALVVCSLLPAGGLQPKAFTYTASTFTQRGSSNMTQPVGAYVYVRITRDGSNNVSFYCSANGIAWQLIATQAFTFTVGEIGFRFNNAAATDTRFFIDFLRSDV